MDRSSIKVTESFATGLLKPNRSKRRSLRRCHFHSKLGRCPDMQYLLWASVSQPWEDSTTFQVPFRPQAWRLLQLPSGRAALFLVLSCSGWATPGLCPVLFLLLDPLQTQSWQQHTGAAEASSFPELLAGRSSRNQKGVQGPTGRTAQLAAGFSREPQKGGHAFCPAHCKGCFGHAVTRGVCTRFPLSRADSFGERLITGR